MNRIFQGALLGCAVAVCLAAALPAAAAEPTGNLAYDARLDGYPYPFEVRLHAFESQEQALEMAYMTLRAQEGGGDAPWVTLLHGKNFNGAYWQQTAQALLEDGYNVLIPDQIGFGKSSKPARYQFSFAALATNTAGLMDALGIERTLVVGHSMGGMLAARFALMFPGRTEKLVLVNPIGLENYLEYAEYRDVAFFYGMELGKTAEKIRAYQQKNYYDGAWNDRYEALTAPLVGWVQGPDRELMAWVNALTYDMIFTQPVVTELGDLQVPFALVLGTRDRTGPGRGWMRPGVTHELGRYDLLGGRIADVVPGLELYELEGLGHLPQIEDFGRFWPVFAETLDRD